VQYLVYSVLKNNGHKTYFQESQEEVALAEFSEIIYKLYLKNVAVELCSFIWKHVCLKESLSSLLPNLLF
jgi:hypothetical protein